MVTIVSSAATYKYTPDAHILEHLPPMLSVAYKKIRANKRRTKKTNVIRQIFGVVKRNDASICARGKQIAIGNVLNRRHGALDGLSARNALALAAIPTANCAIFAGA